MIIMVWPLWRLGFALLLLLNCCCKRRRITMYLLRRIGLLLLLLSLSSIIFVIKGGWSRRDLFKYWDYHLTTLQGVDLSWCPAPPFVQTVWKLSSFVPPPEMSFENHCSNMVPSWNTIDSRKAEVFPSHKWEGGFSWNPKNVLLSI